MTKFDECKNDTEGMDLVSRPTSSKKEKRVTFFIQRLQTF